MIQPRKSDTPLIPRPGRHLPAVPVGRLRDLTLPGRKYRQKGQARAQGEVNQKGSQFAQ